MICPAPDCTGRHGTGTRVAERCPAATERKRARENGYYADPACRYKSKAAASHNKARRQLALLLQEAG